MSKKWLILLAPIIVIIVAGVAWLRRSQAIAQDEQCINNLRQIDGATAQWALEKFFLGYTNRPWSTDYIAYFNSVPTTDELIPYLGRYSHPMPQCPRGGKYTIGHVSVPPKCSYPDHKFPEMLEQDIIPGFVRGVLIDTYADGATELIIGVTHGDVTPMKCKIDNAWRETKIPSYLRPGMVTELQRLAHLPGSKFPSEGAFIITVASNSFKWRVQVKSADSECILTPIRE